MQLEDAHSAPTLERLIVLWNQVEEAFNALFKRKGIDRHHTFFWEEAKAAGVLDQKDIEALTALRMIRNKQVHSSSLDRKQVEYAVALAEQLLTKLKNNG